jgi:hypothetical protein
MLWGDRPLLDWFDGKYKRCFVALHPFFRIPKVDPERCMHGALVLDATKMPDGTDFLEWSNVKYEEHSKGKVLDAEAVHDASRLFGEPISWREICQGTTFADYNSLMIALLSSNRGYKARFHNEELARVVDEYCRREKLFKPTDNELQPLMHPAFCALLEAYGATQVVMRDEFGSVEQTISLQYAKECGLEPAAGSPEPYCPHSVSTEDEALYIGVEFDRFFALIFERDDRVQREAVESLFEGFWCTEETTLSWEWQSPQSIS